MLTAIWLRTHSFRPSDLYDLTHDLSFAIVKCNQHQRYPRRAHVMMTHFTLRSRLHLVVI